MLIITANKRLAQTLLTKDAQEQLASGKKAWEAPWVLPFGVWQRQLWDAWVVEQCELGNEPPILLTNLQTKILWQQIIEENAQSLSQLLHPALLSTQAMNAWKLINAWQIDIHHEAFNEGTPEHQQFSHWAQAFLARCKQNNWCDESRLLSTLTPSLGINTLLPAHIKLVGFVQMTAVEISFWQQLVEMGVTVEGLIQPELVSNMPQLALSFASISDEQDAISAWVAEELEKNKKAHLVIALPNMQQWRDVLLEKVVLRAASKSLLPMQLDAPLPINLSLGDPLAQQPLVAIARLVLGLHPKGIEHQEVLSLLYSPFTGGKSEDLRLAHWLNEAQTAYWSWASLEGRMQSTQTRLIQLKADFGGLSDKNERLLITVAQGLKRLAQWKPNSTRYDRNTPSEWGAWMQSRLQQVGITLRGLGSIAYQAYRALEEQIENLAPLDLISGSVSLDKALSLLDGLLLNPWQARQGKSQVHILGMMEAVGIECDAIWVADMGLEQWPPKATPNAFIPPILQKQAGVRDTDPNKQTDYARHLFAAVVAYSPQITVSHARSDGSRVDLLPTGLLAVNWENMSAYHHQFSHIKTTAMHDWQDWQAPALADNEAANGGTSLFKYQSQCPFSAFAQLRLNAKAIKQSSESPDASLRGTLVHNSLEAVWKEIKTSTQLLALSSQALEVLVSEKVKETLLLAQDEFFNLLGARYVALEQARIVNLILQVLALDATLVDSPSKLPAFKIESEANLTRSVCGVSINLRIDRLQTFESQHTKKTWIIDYKTGTVSSENWQGERPWDPQLPVYALALKDEKEVVGVAFYALKDSDNPELKGLSRDDLPLPKSTKKTLFDNANWQTQLIQWQHNLQLLADDFRNGVAVADPIIKTNQDACRYCHLNLLCRKSEWMRNQREEIEEVENSA